MAIAGAGVFGLCVALRLAASGARVVVYDPAPLGANASGVAAGMIAPLGEMAFDGVAPDLSPLLRRARDAWAPLERDVPGLAIARGGCRYHFAEAQDGHRALALAQDLGDGDAVLASNGTLFSTCDWWLDPPTVLPLMAQALLRAGGELRQGRLPHPRGSGFDGAVLCPGPGGPALATMAPDLLALAPIKGHVVRFYGGRQPSWLERRPDLYLAPQTTGVVAGATMEHGAADSAVSAAIVERLRERAVAVRPDLAVLPFTGAAGVRMAAPDGLPLVGPAGESGVYVAAGARRNGWLLGPLVAEILLAYFTGAQTPPDAARLSPARFACDGAERWGG